VTQPEGKGRSWLRPLGLFGLVLALAIASPLALIGIPLALLCFLTPEAGLRSAVVGAALLILVFSGAPASGIWYLERGWAILVGAWFVAASLAWPDRSFVLRALAGLGGGTASAAGILAFLGGWPVADQVVRERLEASAAATSEVFGGLLPGNAGEAGMAFQEAVVRTAEIQGVLFPAVLAMASIAALGVAWWLHVKLTRDLGSGLEPLKRFRFPDPLIWLLIGGICLLLGFGWTEGLGRMGANLLVFMVGLYALRGLGVILFLTGGLSVPAMVLAGLAVLLLPPLVVAGAMAVGVGDSWFDLRARNGAVGPVEGDE